MIKADLHVHTRLSIDSNMSDAQLIAACQRKGINCVAVADHGTTKAARALSKIAPIKIIICEEVRTPHGEIMGMFLQDDIPDKISVEDTIKAIREQSGLICIPHPYDIVRPSAFRNKQLLESLAVTADIIEVFNSRSLYPGVSNKARKLAQRHNKAMSVGSDAHSPSEVGYSYAEMDDFDTKEEFLTSLSKATLYGRKSNIFIHFVSSAARLRKNLERGRLC